MSSISRMLQIMAAISLCHCVCGQSPDEPLGISTEKPSDGIFVKVGQRYMVPYTEKIPGTNVAFHMIPVEGGTYLMGSPPDENGRSDDEGPQIQVRVTPMWVGKYEVTQAEYREFEQLFYIFLEIDSRRGDGDPNAPDAVTAPTPLYEPVYVYELGNTPQHPAVCMTQFAAKQYTKWISALTKKQYRLPTEAEWEYACRGRSQSAYSWGNDVKAIKDHAWFIGNTNDGYAQVGKQKPNRFGLYDMHGNVGEWTVNGYTKDGYAWLVDRQPVDAVSAVIWPKTESSCVVRGGTWDFDADRLRCAARLESNDEEWKDNDPMLPRSPFWFTSDPARGIGFRLFRSLEDLNPPVIDKFWNHMAPDLREAVELSVESGRGKVGLLDDRLLPATVKYKVQHARREEEKRRRQERIRNARPGFED